MKRFITSLVTASLIAILFASLFSFTVSAQAPLQARWEAVVELHPEAALLADGNRITWTQPLQAQGVQAGLENGWFSLQGQEDLAQMRAALFDTAAPWMDFLGGPVELTIYLPSDEKPLTLNLEARNTTGYIWEVIPGDGVYQQTAEPTFTMRQRGMGAPAIQTIQFRATEAGDAAVRLVYRRPFEPAAAPHARVSIWLSAAANVIDLSDPTPAVTVEDDWLAGEEDNPIAELETKALPASWDWRTEGIVPAVRDQKSCGSCWAFGTVGVMESAIKKGGGPMADLSEQFLVSCNKDGWGCNGGLTATKYHYNTLGRNQTQAGAVLESVKPYTAKNGTCTVALAHPYKASGWQFITGSEWTMPTVDQIKNAIYTYGPVTAGVCADSGWNYYSGGVYNPTSNQCGGYTNHQIVLVGWDDATSSWILRNSWGTGWGEAGYMRIRWDTTGTKSRVGEGTSWVRYAGASSGIPVLVSPAGTITDRTPTFKWKKVTGATLYRFQVLKGTTVLYTKRVSSSACGTTYCINTPTTALAYAAHKWRAQAYVGGVWKTFSAYKNFTVSRTAGSLDSTFYAATAGWTPVYDWDLAGSAFYKTNVGADR